MENIKISKYVGGQIRKYRLLRNMTQKELGEKIGVKHNTISSYETGINEPEQDILYAIAKILDISIDELFPSVKNDLMNAVSELVAIPVVGGVSCGKGMLAYEDIEGYEPTPKEWVTGGEYFYLRAKGDSMIEARIHDGDLLLIRRQPDVENGEIAVVMIDDETAVLKRVYKNDNQIILQSGNSNYPPIFTPPAKVKIIGKLKRNVIVF